MILPIGDENPTERTPLVNYAIIGANVVAFLALAFGPGYGETLHAYGLVPAEPEPFDFVTSMFLHVGVLHLLGNMLYLWIFGDNVEDRLGRLGYVGFYLGGGICASVLHMLFAPGSAVPMVGASGAVSAALGFYAVYYPRRRVKLIYWVFVFWFGSFTMAAGWAIGLWFVTQFLFGLLSEAGEAGVAYWAHVGGFGFGVLVGLASRVASTKTAARAAGGVRAEPIPVRTPGPPPRRVPIGRHQALDALAESDPRGFLRSYDRTARVYGERRVAPHLVLHAAELFRSSKRYSEAARAYERFVLAHPQHPEVPRATYALGALYAHRLRRPARALRWLRRAAACPECIQARRELKELTADLARIATKPAEELVEPCTIIRQTMGPVRERETARAVGRLTGVARAEVVRRLRRSKGILAGNLDAREALVAAEYLQAMGVPVLVLDSTQAVRLPPAKALRSLSLNDEGLELGTDDTKEHRPWGELFMAPAAYAGTVLLGLVFRGGERWKMDLRAPGAPAGLVRVARTLIERLGCPYSGPGLELIREGKLAPGEWRELILPAENAFDEYVRWLYLLKLHSFE